MTLKFEKKFMSLIYFINIFILAIKIIISKIRVQSFSLYFKFTLIDPNLPDLIPPQRMPESEWKMKRGLNICVTNEKKK
jgi:hypothetical protein